MVLCGISTPFGVLFPCLGKVAHALLTRPPLKQLVASYSLSPLDLHVLGTPPAFVLSQDQTLSLNPLSLNRVSSTKFHSFGITVLFALLLFCIVFKVRTGFASAFEAARVTSFVSILLFRPPVKGFFEGFCGFFETFGIYERLLRFQRIIVRYAANFLCFFLFVYSPASSFANPHPPPAHQKSPFPIEEGAFLCNLEITQSPWRAAWPDEPSYDWQHSCA